MEERPLLGSAIPVALRLGLDVDPGAGGGLAAPVAAAPGARGGYPPVVAASVTAVVPPLSTGVSGSSKYAPVNATAHAQVPVTVTSASSSSSSSSSSSGASSASAPSMKRGREPEEATVTTSLGDPIPDFFEIPNFGILPRRQLDVEAYAAVVTAFRARGELTWRRAAILEELRNELDVSMHRHVLELARAETSLGFTSPLHEAEQRLHRERADRDGLYRPTVVKQESEPPLKRPRIDPDLVPHPFPSTNGAPANVDLVPLTEFVTIVAPVPLAKVHDPTPVAKPRPSSIVAPSSSFVVVPSSSSSTAVSTSVKSEKPKSSKGDKKRKSSKKSKKDKAGKESKKSKKSKSGSKP